MRMTQMSASRPATMRRRAPESEDWAACLCHLGLRAGLAGPTHRVLCLERRGVGRLSEPALLCPFVERCLPTMRFGLSSWVAFRMLHA